MAKRLSHRYVKNFFKKKRYELLSRYKNSRTKLKFKCPNGHIRYIWWGDFKNGVRCSECVGLVKKDIEFIRSDFEKNSYILLTKKYKNCYQKLDYICSNGHKHSVSWNDWWHKKSRCPYCSNKIRKTIEIVKLEFDKEDYILLTKEYTNAHQKLEYICSEGHEHSITWINWSNGHRCPTCRAINMVGECNHRWKGGISCEPYCDIWLDKDFKESIKERDGNKCQNPDCWGTSKKLTIHHIDYNKKNCHPWNLITLCNSCNARANHGREWHTLWYQTILNKKQGYIYDRKN